MSRDAIFIDSNRLGVLLNSVGDSVAAKKNLLTEVFANTSGYVLTDDMRVELSRTNNGRIFLEWASDSTNNTPRIGATVGAVTIQDYRNFAFTNSGNNDIMEIVDRYDELASDGTEAARRRADDFFDLVKNANVGRLRAEHGINSAQLTDVSFMKLVSEGRSSSLRINLLSNDTDLVAFAGRVGGHKAFSSASGLLFDAFTEGDLEASTYKIAAEGFRENLRNSTNAADVRILDELFSDADVDAFNGRPGFLPDTSGSADIRFGLLGGALALFAKLGFVGDIIGFSLVVNEAQDLYQQGKVDEATRLLVVYAFDIYGGIVGGAIGLGLGLSTGPIGAITVGLVSSVIGSLAGAELGGFLFDTFTPFFRFVTEAIEEALVAINEDDDLAFTEAFVEGVFKALGFDFETVQGTDGVDLLISVGDGSRFGAGGDDTLIVINPEFHFQGDLIDPNAPPPAEGEADERARFEQDTGVVLDGGDGNDVLVSLGGEGATLIGGAGRDLLFSFGTRGAQLFGNEIDAAANQTSQDESDLFFWSPGAFINDADPVDFLSLFGFTLTGGSNFFTAGSGFIIDSLFWFSYYGATTSGQLLVGNAIFDIFALRNNPNADALDRLLIVEDYDYAGEFGATLDNFGNADGGIRNGVGDLGLRFRVYGADNGEEISLFNAVWGEVIFFLGQFETFVKGLNWFFEGDPLILDLDGDGIETIRESQSEAFFDFDDDFFAERTGWVSSDDGILAVDLEGDGIIDDISELFGGNNVAGDAPGQRGFAALSEYDSNSDGVVDARDDNFDDILVSDVSTYVSDLSLG